MRPTEAEPASATTEARAHLVRCDTFWGASALREGDPPTVAAVDAIYTPYDHGSRWGVFDSSGRPIPAATDFRGPSNLPIDQVAEISGAIDEAPWASDDEYVYAGRFNPHFGHFLVETLPRLWWLARQDRQSRKLLMHGAGTPEGWFGRDFASRIWGALDLAPADIAVFDRPTRIRQLSVPAPALQQQTYVHDVFGLLCRTVGARMLRHADLTRKDVPVYLSKSKLDLGVHVFVEEEALEARLAEAGVEIVHPQHLGLDAQVRLFETRPAILGPTGSAFHACIFARETPRQMTLSPSRAINANFALLDRVSGNRTEHFHQEGTVDLGPSERYHARHALADPRAAADDLLRLLNEVGVPPQAAQEPIGEIDAPPHSFLSRALNALRRRR